MAYVPTDDLKRMSNMLLNNAEIIASNYCFAFNHDEPGDEEDVTSQLLKFFGEKIMETEEALQQQPCDKCAYSTSEGCQYDDITETIPPFEDTISRQAAIDCVMGCYDNDELFEVYEDRLNELPPIQPKAERRKTCSK